MVTSNMVTLGHIVTFVFAFVAHLSAVGQIPLQCAFVAPMDSDSEAAGAEDRDRQDFVRHLQLLFRECKALLLPMIGETAVAGLWM